MIQDIAPHTFDNSYKPLLPDENSFFILFKGCQVLVKKENTEIRFPRYDEITGENGFSHNKPIYYFSIDDQTYFGLETWDTIPDGFVFTDIHIFRESLPRHTAFAGVTAFGLSNWYANHKYCGRCGQLTQQHPKERMLQCPSCSNNEYPKISPAVIVGVTNGNKILLTKYANRPYTNYALIAGFAEIGETIEQTVHREVMEEAGVKIKNIRYYKSQPWAFTDCLLMGFFAEVDGDDTITMDQEELAVAEWVNRNDMEPGNAALSLTGEMIEYFRTGNFEKESE